MESLVGSPKSFSLLLDLDGNEEHHHSADRDVFFASYQTRDMSGFSFGGSITNRLNIPNILSIDLRSNQTQRARWIVKRCLLSVSFVCSFALVFIQGGEAYQKVIDIIQRSIGWEVTKATENERAREREGEKQQLFVTTGRMGRRMSGSLNGTMTSLENNKTANDYLYRSTIAPAIDWLVIQRRISHVFSSSSSFCRVESLLCWRQLLSWSTHRQQPGTIRINHNHAFLIRSLYSSEALQIEDDEESHAHASISSMHTECTYVQHTEGEK